MKLKIKFKFVVLAGMLSASLLLPFGAGAVGGGLVPCGNNDSTILSPSGGTSPTLPADTCKLGDIFKLIARVTNFLVGLSGLYAVYRILMASYDLITAAGSDEKISSGRKGLENAITGLAIVLLAYLLVNTIFAVFGPKVGVQSGFLYNPFN